MSWINDFVAKHRFLESPVSFWLWSGLAAISAVVKDNIYLDRGAFKTYCNIYVMLHADSGLKKGPPVNACKQLVQNVNNTRVISGRASIQGILKKLGHDETSKGGKLRYEGKSTALICASELTSAIVDDPVATKILTDLYDRHYNAGDWESLLKQEQFDLKDPTVTMLSATNESMSEDFLSKSAIKGGYLARTFVIFESKRNIINSLIAPLAEPPDYKELSGYLKEIAQLKGPFRALGSLEESDIYCYKREKEGRTEFFCEAGVEYDDWYEDFCQTIDRQAIVDDTGTMNRFGDSVLKVAMLLSLSDDTSLIITPEQIRISINMCERLLGNVRKTTLGKKGMSPQAPLKGLIIQEIFQKGKSGMTRAQLMKKLWMHYTTSEEIDGIMVSLDSAGMIKLEQVGGEIVYRMNEDQLGGMTKLMEGKYK